MARRSKFWRVVVGLFVFINLAGGVFAAVQGELLHAGVHAGLLFGAYLVWRRRQGWVTTDLSRDLSGDLMHIQQSVDALALEVERIGEGQRFITRFLTETGASVKKG